MRGGSDLDSNLAAFSVIPSGSYTSSSIKAGAIDTEGFYSASLLLDIGSVVAGGPSDEIIFTLTDTDSPDLIDLEPVPNDNLIGSLSEWTIGGNTAPSIRRIGYVGGKRYIVMSFLAEGDISARFAVTGILSYPSTIPAVTSDNLIPFVPLYRIAVVEGIPSYRVTGSAARRIVGVIS